jgi:hypothetical protein
VIEATRSALSAQFGAALDMLGNAIEACPEHVWADSSREPYFWYIAHHLLFWTDAYMSEGIESYRPPAPFGLEERDPAGVLPPRVTTREEALAWLQQVRAAAEARIGALNESNARELAEGFPRLGATRLELLLYVLRHVHHHVGQLQLMLRERSDVTPPRWVRRAGAGANRG